MQFGKMEDFTIDQFAGSMALILGSVASLLLVIWKSRCECDMNCCYIWRCHRKPPPEPDSDEEKGETPKSQNNNNGEQIVPQNNNTEEIVPQNNNP